MYKAILRSVDGRALLYFRGNVYEASIGAQGMTSQKAEGDLRTPIASLPLRRVFYRADRTPRPDSALPVEPLAPDDGWCDDPASDAYNRPVRLPFPASCESLWREDHTYDICVELGWNDTPPVPGRGSAIFLHLRPASGVTEGCIALSERDLRTLLAQGLTEIDVIAS